MTTERTARLQTDAQIGRMRDEDVEIVAALDRKCFPTPWSVSAYITEVHNPSGYYIVAKSDGRVVGYAGMWLIMDESHITTIGVEPSFRGMKIGERMLVNLLDEAVHRGARRATLEVRRHNLVAQNLYLKYCFRFAAVRKGYYTNNNEDALVMWVDDMSSDDFLKVFRTRKAELDRDV